MKKTYTEMKEKVREMAMEYSCSQESYSWYEVFCYQEKFRRLGKQYGLLREFRENGII